MRWTAMILSLILPGMGHTALGRPARGIFLTAAFTLGVVALVARAAVLSHPMGDAAFGGILVGTALVYVLCQLAMLHVLIRAAVSAARPAKEDHFRAGLAAAARGETIRAETELRRVLAIDPSDVEAHLNLGALFARQGQRREAKRHLKYCRRFDIEGKWDWEVEQELTALSRATNGKSRSEN